MVRKIKEILRLSEQGLSQRQICKLMQISRTTIIKYQDRAKAEHLQASDCDAFTEEELNELLFGIKSLQEGPAGKWIPEMAEIHQEMKRKGVTLLLLWEEYSATRADIVSYSHLSRQYRRYKKTLNVSMRQAHKAGEKLFVDYAGPTVLIKDPKTQTLRKAQIFIACMGASQYTYAEATWSQKSEDWLMSHRRCLAFLGGVPELFVPDNLKSGVTSPDRYEPSMQYDYEEFAAYYQAAILPARSRMPRDKAKVENSVLLAERWILARLRNREFFSLNELNRAIQELLTDLNIRPFKKMPGCRKSVYEQLEKPMLRALPDIPYEPGEWRKFKVATHYHIPVESNYYSVPNRYVSKMVQIKISSQTITIFDGSYQIAIHARNFEHNQWITVPEHMPESHRRHSELTPKYIQNWFNKSGDSLQKLIQKLIETRQHPALAYQSALGIMRLEKWYSKDRLDAAAKWALLNHAISYKSIQSILKLNLDQNPPEPPSTLKLPENHENIRGPLAFSYN